MSEVATAFYRVTECYSAVPPSGGAGQTHDKRERDDGSQSGW